MGKRELGGCDGVARGGVHDDHAAFGGGIDIDVIHADAGAAHDFEQGRRGKHGGGDLSLGAYGDGVHVLHQLEDFFQRGAVSLNDFEAWLRAQKGDSFR